MARKETITTEEYTYTAVFQPEPEGGFTVTVPALRGCVTYGATMEEARAMVADAIAGCLHVLHKHGDPIPPSEDVEIRGIEREAVTVKLARV